MKLTSAVAAGVALAALASGHSAHARDYGANPLPPVSGTIRLHPGDLAGGWHVRGFRAGHHHYGPYYGYQGGAYRQLWRGSYNTADADVFWNRNVEFYGEGNDTLALLVTGTGAGRRGEWHGDDGSRSSDAQPLHGRGFAANATPAVLTPNTGWGTADSATTGGAYPPPSPIHAASVHVAYGDAGAWSGTSGLDDRYPPTGGIGYYNSGSPGRLGYYSSSSSAGPGGMPGGLSIYSSGSYGPGPRVVELGGQGGRWSGLRRTGPHIIHLNGDGED